MTHIYRLPSHTKGNISACMHLPLTQAAEKWCHLPETKEQRTVNSPTRWCSIWNNCLMDSEQSQVIYVRYSICRSYTVSNELER
jgi:hypothetical protein